MGIGHRRLETLDGVGSVLERALAAPGPSMIEVDMQAVGDFARPFAGPPVRIKEPAAQ